LALPAKGACVLDNLVNDLDNSQVDWVFHSARDRKKLFGLQRSIMSKTSDNLKAAFSGESQARNKYKSYAKKAELDGFPNLAKLFRAAYDAEEIHALRHWRALGMVRDTLQNLEDALAGETYEVMEMYPEFLAQAEKEQEISARNAFFGALEAEKIHMKLYADAIETFKGTGKDIEGFRVYTCEVCGYTHVGDPIDKCPVCNAPWSKFHEVE
jgi:rubrerythrin